jgi:hypothetical protein
VRNEAVRVMGERGPRPGFAAALDHLVRTDPNRRNRLAALAVLIRPEWPLQATEPTLRWARTVDWESGLNRAIEKRLETRRDE